MTEPLRVIKITERWRPFSNGEEVRSWFAAWCEKCRADHPHGDEAAKTCPLFTDARVSGQAPPEWTDLRVRDGATMPPAIACLAFSRCECTDWTDAFGCQVGDLLRAKP